MHERFLPYYYKMLYLGDVVGQGPRSLERLHGRFAYGPQTVNYQNMDVEHVLLMRK